MTKEKIIFIQYLRALSVLLVLIFHIDERWMPSGYLGVDAFFAISGFVITRMIALSVRQQAFSFKEFYTSRIKKLLPPLFYTLAFTNIGFFFIYTPSDYYNLTKSSLFAALSVSNFYFYFDSGYFSESSIFKPLLHTWSLGVEEQFYLIWPLFLISIIKWCKYRIFIVLAFIIASVTSSLYLIGIDFDLVFFLAPLRSYQLLLGAFAALLVMHSKRSNELVLVSNVFMFSLPIFLVGISLTNIDEQIRQFYAQLSVALFVAITCYFADLFSNKLSQQGSVIRSFQYASNAFKYLGDRSYHIYLVHWPIITATHVMFPEQQSNLLLIKLIPLVLSLAVAEIIFKISDPHNKTGLVASSFRFRLSPPLYVFILISIIPGFYQSVLKSDPQFQDSNNKNLTKVLRNELTNITSKIDCYIKITPSNITESVIQQRLKNCLSKEKFNVLSVGDSLSRGVFLALRESKKNGVNNFNHIRIFVAGCPPYFGNDPTTHAKLLKVKGCAQFKSFPWKYVYQEILSNGSIDSIYLAGNWFARSLSKKAMSDSMSILDTLSTKISTRIFLVGARPIYSESVVRLYQSGKISPNNSSLRNHLANLKYFDNQASYNKELARESGYHVNIEYLDIYNMLCGRQGCPAFDNQELIYYDNMHLSLKGIEYLSRKIQ